MADAGGSKLYLMVPVRAAAQAGIDPAPHLRAVGIDPAGPEDQVFDRAAVNEVWHRLADAVGDPVWGLHIAEAQAADTTAFGVIEYAARNSRDLGDAYERVARYARLMHHGVDARWARNGGSGSLSYRIPDLGRGPNRYAAEWAVASWMLRGRRYVGENFAPLEARFHHGAPSDLSEYRRIFGASLRFGAEDSGVTISEEHLKKRVTGADDNLARVMDAHARALLAKLPDHDCIERDLRAHLMQVLSSGGDSSLPALAARLRINERVLQKKMKEERLVHRTLVDDCRRDLALRMVDAMSTEDLSFVLGFAKKSTFKNAFKRWTKDLVPERPPMPRYRADDPVGLAQELRHDPISMFLNMLARHGDICDAKVGHLRGVFLFAPDAVERVLVTNAANYQKKEQRSYKPLKQFLRQGLVTSEGELHRRQRKLLQPAFHKQKIEAFFSIMCRHAEALAEQWRAAAKTGLEVDVTDGIYAMTLAIIGETMLGADLSADAEAIGRAVSTIMSRMHWSSTTFLPLAELWPSAKNRDVERARRFLDEKVEAIIDERTAAGGERDDLLGMLIAQAEDNGSLTREQIADEVLTMFVAGHETTAVALTWALWLLSTHSLVRERLEAELERELGNRALTLADVPKLRYVGQVVDEVLRLYPSVWALAREAADDDVLSGYPIPAGTKVFFSPYAIHRHPRYWDHPERFDPERLSPEKREELPKYAYFPYSGGGRKCIGDTFAQLELVGVLATLFRVLRFETRAGYVPVPSPNVTLPAADGLPMKIKIRG